MLYAVPKRFPKLNYFKKIRSLGGSFFCGQRQHYTRFRVAIQ